MNLSDIDLNDLDFNNVGQWPAAVRGVVLALVAALVVGLGYWFFTRDALAQLDTAARHETELKQQLQAKAAKAANLEAYEAQLKEMRTSFGAMLRQLPNKTEVADLLVDVSQTGLASGLEFELFKPQAEVPKDFYAELPIAIKVHGTYHDFGNFISGVASLPRIVTLHDISITPAGGKKGQPGGQLVMNLTAKTYRYLEAGEIQAKEKGK